MSLHLMIVGYALYYCNPLFLGILVLNLVCCKFYIIFPDKETMTRLERGIKGCTKMHATYIVHEGGRDMASGLFFGRSCVAYFNHRGNDSSVVYLFTSASTYAKMMQDEPRTLAVAKPKPVTVPENSTSIQVYIRKGCYKNFYYAQLRLNLGHLQPLGDQPHVIDGIMDIYRKHERASIFLYGAAGTGKSSVGYFVAKQMRGKYCHSFNPSDPGDTLLSLLNYSDSHEDSPLVVVLEEVDEILNRLHQGIPRHAEVPILVHNKSTWTAFLDDMIFYKHVVLICTSNKSKLEMDALDPAYLRDGRIHASFSMTAFSNP